MALKAISIDIPLTGSLQTKNAPLMQDPGTLLTADNVIQERRGEWRRRNGFTSAAAESTSFTNGPWMVANVAQTGMVAIDHNKTLLFAPDVTSNLWRNSAGNPNGQDSGADVSSATPLVRGATQLANAYASNGTFHLTVAVVGTGVYDFMLFDAGGVPVTDSITTIAAAGNSTTVGRCTQGPSGFLCGFINDISGNLIACVANLSTGTLAQSTIKTGLTVGLSMDAYYYGGSTITVVCQMAAGGFQFIEFNPSTVTKATDINIVSGTVSNALSLMPEPSGSGTRLVGVSTTAPSTVVYRLTSAGGILSQDTAEAASSLAITGCANNSGADWAVVYLLSGASAHTKRNTKVAGVVGTSAIINSGTTTQATPLTVDGMGFGVSGDSKWYCMLGQHSQNNTTDPQDTSILCSNTFTASDVWFRPQATIAPLQALIRPVFPLCQVQNISGRSFKMGMMILTAYANGPTQSIRDFCMYSFAITLPTGLDVGTLNIGQPAYRGTAKDPILPLNSLRTVELSGTIAIGLNSPPPQIPSIAQAATGSLTLLGVYQWCYVIETVNRAGQIWRSPPSVPRGATLTGANNSVTFTVPMWGAEDQMQYRRLKVYRTQNIGSTFNLCQVENIAPAVGQPIVDISITDQASDASIVGNEILYTTGEQINLCWPPASHCWIFDDRLWAVNRDFRTEVQYSKNLQPNRQPETTAANALDIDDQWGDITGGSSVEGRGVIFKRNAIYFVQGDGLTDSGSGTNYTFTRVSDDIGALPGTPLINMGDAIMFVSERGIYSINNQGTIAFIGAAVDAFFDQPLVLTSETVYDGCWVSEQNQARLVTTNYVLVYDRDFPDANGIGQWSRWTGPMCPSRRCLVVNGGMVLFKTDGTVWREDLTGTQTTDNGTTIPATLRTAWVRYDLNGANRRTRAQLGMRFYSGRASFTRTSGGLNNLQATANVYYSDDDSQTQSFTSQNISGGTLTDVGEFFPTQQKCTSFSLAFTWPSAADLTFRLQGFSANLGIRDPADLARPAGEKWS